MAELRTARAILRTHTTTTMIQPAPDMYSHATFQVSFINCLRVLLDQRPDILGHVDSTIYLLVD